MLDTGGGTFLYIPGDGQTGWDSFEFTIGDGRGGTATATLRLRLGSAQGLVFVTSDADPETPTPGTLRQAIATASAGSTIVFSPGVERIVLSQGQLEVSSDIAIDGGEVVTIDGDGASRVFFITGAVSLSHLTITGGAYTSTWSTPQNGGGGIFNDGELTLTNVIVANNTVSSSGGPAMGGGILNAGQLTVVGGAIDDNFVGGVDAAWAGGGGIFTTDGATTALFGATISNNVAVGVEAEGGGLWVAMGATVTFSTGLVSGNAIAAVDFSLGGGITVYGTLTLDDVDVTQNTNVSGLPYGGGIYLYWGSAFAASGGDVWDNFSAFLSDPLNWIVDNIY